MKTKRIVLVDDNKELTNIFCNLFNIFKEMLNLNIEISDVLHNGQDAIDYVQLNKPDIVLLDIIMPDMNGFDVLYKVQKLNIENKPKFIMLSGLVDEQTVSRAYALDAVSFIKKPFDMREVISIISNI